MKTLLTIITLTINLASTELFGQATGVLKIDLDTTIIYVDIGVVYELSGKNISDTLRKLMDASDTIICKDFKTLVLKNRTYDFDIRTGLKRALKRHHCDIYFMKNNVQEYSIHKKRKRRNHILYSFSDTRTKKTFLRLGQGTYSIINESW